MNRMTEMADAGISADVITMILRSEGVLDTDIAAGYDSLIASGRYTIEVDRNIPRFIASEA